MSGSTPTNSAAVDFEKQQAAEADAKEAARQASLQQGQTLIDQIFSGSPVMGTKTSNYDWSTFTPGSGLMPASGMPAGYTAVRVPGAPTTTAAPGGRPGAALISSSPQVAGQYNTGRYASPASSVASTLAAASSPSAMTWGLQDASGKITKQGDPLSITSQYDTGQRTGGFDDAFYNSYKQKVLDYYQPDEQRQYDEAQRNLTYNLARAGTLQSSTAGDKMGELAYNDALQKANIVANANAQTGNLQNQIQANKESLINQLYATSDPTLTANLAESSAAASRMQDPTLTPAASLFTPALTAVGSAYNAYSSPYSTVAPGAMANPAAMSPTPASSSASSGKTINYQ
jgi:hypothetical protein